MITSIASAGVASLFLAGCMDSAVEPDETTSQELAQVPEDESAEGVVIASDHPELVAAPQILAPSCVTHKGNTAGWADCTGSGTVRIRIDCKAPQITDFVGQWTAFNGSVTIRGECNFGINSVTVESR